MPKLVWTGLALLLAFAAALTAFCLVSGLPADFSLQVWSPTLRWSPSRVGTWIVSGAVFALALAVVFLTYAVFVELWIGLGLLTDFILPIPSTPSASTFEVARRLGLRALLAFVAIASFISGFFKNVFAIVPLLIAFLGLSAVFFAQRAIFELRENRDRLAVRSRSSAIGGGQTEWRISPALLFAILAFALAGGTVTLAGLAVRPSPPSAAKEETKSIARESSSPLKPAEAKLPASPTSSTEK